MSKPHNILKLDPIAVETTSDQSNLIWPKRPIGNFEDPRIELRPDTPDWSSNKPLDKIGKRVKFWSSFARNLYS